MRVQIAAAHEASLCRMRVYPANDQQLLLVAVVEELLFVERLTRIARACLLWHDETRDEERIRLENAAEHAACLKIQTRVV